MHGLLSLLSDSRQDVVALGFQPSPADSFLQGTKAFHPGSAILRVAASSCARETGFDSPPNRDQNFLSLASPVNQFGKPGFAVAQGFYHVTIVVS